LFWFFTKNVLAFSNIAVKMSELKSPTNLKNFSLSFVVLDIQNRDLIAKCFIKKPNSFSFVQFDSTKNILAGGNSGECNVNSSDLNNVGNYEFYVSIETSGEIVNSNIVKIDFDDQVPEKIVFYQKINQADKCSFEIKFKTANDNQTNKVVLYRLTDENLVINNDTKISEKAMSPNQEGSFFVSNPDCNKNYYFFLRAFDNANNSSEIVGDDILNQEVLIQSDAQEENNFEKPILVSSSQIKSGEVLGEEDQENLDFEVSGDAVKTENLVDTNYFYKYKNVIIFLLIVLFSYFIFNMVFKKSSKK